MNQELINQLKANPEALKQAAQAAGLIKDEETEKLFAPLDVDEMTSAPDVAKLFNERLKGIQKYVEKAVESGTSSIRTELEDKSKQTEIEKIQEFAATHPELKAGSPVALMMEQLYAKNKDLEDVYKKACTVEGVKPTAIVNDKTVNLTTGKEIDKDGKEVGEAKIATSLKSDTLASGADDLDDGVLKPEKDIEGKSLREIAEGNWNKALADAGVADMPD